MMEKKNGTSRVFLLVVAFALPGCSRDRLCSEFEVQVLGDHAHSAKVSSDRVKRGAGRAFRVHGADHDHAVSLGDKDVQKLGPGASVTVRTSSANAHVHEATVRCSD